MKTFNRLNWGFIGAVVLDLALLWALIAGFHHLYHYRLLPWQ